MNATRLRLITTATALLAGQSALAQTILSAKDAAARFGALEEVQDIALSPDGKRVVYITQRSTKQTAAMVAVVDASAERTPRAVAVADGKPARLIDCGWASTDRVICRQYGVVAYAGSSAAGLPVIRTFSIDPDGKGMWSLGQRAPREALRISQFDGAVIDWGAGTDGQVLMTRDYVPEFTTGTEVRHRSHGRPGVGAAAGDRS